MDKNKLLLFAVQASLLVVLFIVYHTWGFWPAIIGVGLMAIVVLIVTSRR